MKPESTFAPPSRCTAALLYALMLATTAGVFLWVRAAGQSGAAGGAASAAATLRAPVRQESDVLLHVLLALVVVIIAGQLAARLFAWLRQPPVIGEVLAGIALGPSLLGAISPDVYRYLLPQEAAPFLGLVAQLGVILYMFVVGLDLDAAVLRNRAVVAIAHAGIVAPFVLGMLLALGLYTPLAPPHVPFTPFALFLGASMSVTAFPVLARILSDRGMTRTRLGVIALASAATGDATAWCLLALVVGAAQAQVGGAMLVVLWTALYLAAMLLVARPALSRLAPRLERRGLTKGVASVVFAALLLSAWLTEWIGIHALFGAFLLGAVIPHDSRIARELPRRFEDMVTVIMLPAFFALTGMRTEIGLIRSREDWLWCAAIIAVATIGKFGGSALAARLAGMRWQEASALGILMNTRGMMELIVLNIGLDLGVISPRLFAMMVLMALVTTMIAAPLLHLLRVHREEEGAPGLANEETAIHG